MIATMATQTSKATDAGTPVKNPPASTSPTTSPTDLPMEDGRIVSTPGDVRTEPVATERESHVAGRVGPATIAEDTDAPLHVLDGLDEVAPGTPGPGHGGVLPAMTDDPTGEALVRLTERIEAQEHEHAKPGHPAVP